MVFCNFFSELLILIKLVLLVTIDFLIKVLYEYSMYLFEYLFELT